MQINNRWVNASGDLDEKPITIHYREQWQTAQEQHTLPICIQIAWNANSRDESTSFPSKDEQETILAFGEQLQAHMEGNDNAVLVMMIMHDGVCQWVLYCADLEQAQKDLDSVPTENGLYPIDVVSDEDPNWDIFTKVHQAIVEAA